MVLGNVDPSLFIGVKIISFLSQNWRRLQTFAKKRRIRIIMLVVYVFVKKLDCNSRTMQNLFKKKTIHSNRITYKKHGRGRYTNWKFLVSRKFQYSTQPSFLRYWIEVKSLVLYGDINIAGFSKLTSLHKYNEKLHDSHCPSIYNENACPKGDNVRHCDCYLAVRAPNVCSL